MSNHYQTIIEKAYKAFNERDIDTLISYMQPGVDWPNGMEGGYLKGTEQVRGYWQKQWKEMNPQVLPLLINETEEGLVKVKVHQLVKDLQGNIVVDAIIRHTYTFENGLIKKMEIGKIE